MPTLIVFFMQYFFHQRSVGAAELEERTDEFGKKQRFLSGAGFVQPFMDIW